MGVAIAAFVWLSGVEIDARPVTIHDGALHRTSS
jgi:hypothetical protein